MNIFVLDLNPQIAASYHCDDHVKKMPIETCQMLNSAIYFLNGISSRKERIDPKNIEFINEIFEDYPLTENTSEKYGDNGPGLAFVNHPCSIWARESYDNFVWLLELGKHLCLEYITVFKNSIICDSQLCWIEDWSLEHKTLFEKTELSTFAQAMPDKYRDKDPVKAYKNYYNGEKSFATWKNRRKPE